MIKCEICNKEFKSKLGLAGHKRMHGPSNGTANTNFKTEIINGIKYIGSEYKLTNIKRYYDNPKSCVNCKNQLPYHKRNNQFCCQSCSASTNNILRGTRTDETKLRISKTLKKVRPGKPKESKPKKPKTYKPPKVKVKRPKKVTQIRKSKFIEGIWHITCAHCNELFVSKVKQKYCQNHAHLYKSLGKNRYKFTFNVFEYPDLFDLELIKQKGWHSHGGRYNYNPEGLTRDHKISINEAIRNNYDPYYIKHPLNCEIMSFEENNKKKTKSSLTYDVLVNLVDEYD